MIIIYYILTGCFLYFHKFLPPTKWEKIVRPRIEFLPPNWHQSPNWHFPQLALSPSGTSSNWQVLQIFFCAIANLSLPTPGTQIFMVPYFNQAE